MWHYLKDGVQHGPISHQELKAMADSGELLPTDQVWKESLKDWVPASRVKGLFANAAQRPSLPPITPTKDRSSPPPPPAALSIGPAGSNLLNPRKRLLYGYRAALIMAAVASLLPWISITSSMDYNSDRIPGMSGYSRFGFNAPEPVRTSGSASIGIRGTSMIWGDLILLIGIAGAVLSFVGPEKFLKEKARLGMAGIGAAIILLAVLVVTTYSSPGSAQSDYRDAFGNSASLALSYGIGMYLAFVAGLGAAVTGYLHNWESASSL